MHDKTIFKRSLIGRAMLIETNHITTKWPVFEKDDILGAFWSSDTDQKPFAILPEAQLC